MLAKFAHNHDVDEVKKLGVRPRDRFKSRFNNVLLIDATDRSKISRDQKRFFIALSLYPLSFFANTPFKKSLRWKEDLLWMKRRMVLLKDPSGG